MSDHTRTDIEQQLYERILEAAYRFNEFPNGYQYRMRSGTYSLHFNPRNQRLTLAYTETYSCKAECTLQIQLTEDESNALHSAILHEIDKREQRLVKNILDLVQEPE
jgi:hypothetical protein